ncbi:flagellar filament capping protein FliD [uncultured Acetatifactor sp.]|uniref:flagellar filament capping protein FliD n=1 Tax=uncultured Acetatifactor sp. TaxID=1671927 RepID=UPI002615C5C1|nr:flagellar filament capping protein FliD [uncultured Acetatifactor sp.]
MPMRLSGLMSGMDTESIIQQLVEAKKTKVTKAVKAQKSLKYKQDAWKDLNKQIVNLYNKSLTQMRFQSSYIKKVTKVSNSSVVSVITGDGAMNSVQSLEVNQLAKSGYLTGGKMELKDENGDVVKGNVTGKTKLSELGFDIPDGEKGSLQVKVNGEVTNITVDGNSTVENFVSALKSVGLNANFDETNGRIHVSAKTSGADSDFSITAKDGKGFEALEALKLSYGYNDEELKGKYKAIAEMVQADEAQDRIDKKLESLTKSRDSLLAKKATLESYIPTIQGKLGTGITLGSNFNYDDLTEEQQEALAEAVKAAAEDAKAAGNDEAAKALGSWISDWRNTTSSLKTVEDQLDIKTDPSDPTKEIIELKDSVKQEIKAQVAKEASDAQAVLDKLNQTLTPDEMKKFGQKTGGQDAKISLNGVEYTSSKNTFEINGLTLTVSAETNGNPVTITTEDDTNGIYDMIKNFFKEYNTIINQMDKLYNADSAKGYDPLTDEEKEAMSDSAIEEWENKIKDSILRKDSTLSTFSGAMKQIMMEGVEVNGKKMYLSNFGIGTLNYFAAADNERNAYHIDGDPDDENTANNADKLKSMIANDPDTVVSFFTQLSQKLSDKMFDLMKSKEGYSSAMTVYDDKKMQTDYDNYTTQIKELEKKLADYEDKWYAKFAAMETALAKMQNNASAVTSLLGG